MSTLAITAAHFVSIPVRYAVGSNLSTLTPLVYNATELGLYILVRSIVKLTQPVPLKTAALTNLASYIAAYCLPKRHTK